MGQRMRSLSLALLVAVLGACGGGGDSGPRPVAAAPPPAPTPPPAPPALPANLFAVVSDAQWDDTAVRQVLHTFAFGGHAGDAQIRAWADMDPRRAVREMLVLDPRHDLLSPPDPLDELALQGGTLEGMRTYWASDDPTNLIPPQLRDLFDDSDPAVNAAAELTWSLSVTKRGTNPFRQRIGLHETNYHMVVHQLLGNVADRSMIRYYDDIMNLLAADANYEDVLTHAAISAAIATHYGHRENVYFAGRFYGNEDFGREYHQLFFGILGVADPAYHESVTIKNTAQALTGIRVPYTSAGFAAVPTYNPGLHNPNDLEILGTMISGSTAEEKFQALSDTALDHPESLANLPVMIISELADDNLSDAAKAAIRDAWAAMTDKNLLRFLQDYATSPLFHSPERVKRLSTLERHFLVQNLMTLNNLESYINVYDFYSYNDREGVQVFKPTSNVFGNQRGRDAAASSEIFRTVYNASTENWYRFVIPNQDLAGGGVWEKDWRTVLPAPVAGTYTVRAVARWLWERFIADGLDNFGVLERAELFALLANGRNFAWVATGGTDPGRLYSAAELTGDAALAQLIADLGDTPMLFSSADQGERRFANAAVGQAVNFITATPYMFVRTGR